MFGVYYSMKSHYTYYEEENGKEKIGYVDPKVYQGKTKHTLNKSELQQVLTNQMEKIGLNRIKNQSKEKKLEEYADRYSHIDGKKKCRIIDIFKFFGGINRAYR